MLTSTVMLDLDTSQSQSVPVLEIGQGRDASDPRLKGEDDENE
jgi:hypothetical protein